jgi:hypothetical protein
LNDLVHDLGNGHGRLLDRGWSSTDGGKRRAEQNAARGADRRQGLQREVRCPVMIARFSRRPDPGGLAWSPGQWFCHDLNERRRHFTGVLDGSRAATALGYAPSVRIAWPAGWHRWPLSEPTDACPS